MNKHSAQPKKKSRKKVIVAAAAAAVLVPSAAWAAVALFGFGTFDSAATEAQELTIVGAPTTTKNLAPGQTVGVKGIVKNSNDFPIKVTGIVVKNSSAQLTPNEPANCKISFNGGVPKTFPNSDPAAPGTAFELATPVEIGPNQQVWVEVPNVLKQDATATKLCGVKADYAVVGQVGE